MGGGKVRERTNKMRVICIPNNLKASDESHRGEALTIENSINEKKEIEPLVNSWMLDRLDQLDMYVMPTDEYVLYLNAKQMKHSVRRE